MEKNMKINNEISKMRLEEMYLGRVFIMSSSSISSETETRIVIQVFWFEKLKNGV